MVVCADMTRVVLERIAGPHRRVCSHVLWILQTRKQHRCRARSHSALTHTCFDSKLEFNSITYVAGRCETSLIKHKCRALMMWTGHASMRAMLGSAYITHTTPTPAACAIPRAATTSAVLCATTTTCARSAKRSSRLVAGQMQCTVIRRWCCCLLWIVP